MTISLANEEQEESGRKIWPDRVDKFMSLVSLLHIQEIYQLGPTKALIEIRSYYCFHLILLNCSCILKQCFIMGLLQVQNGLPLESSSPGQLSVTQLAEMAIISLKQRNFYRGCEWLEFTMAYLYDVAFQNGGDSGDWRISSELLLSMLVMCVQQV